MCGSQIPGLIKAAGKPLAVAIDGRCAAGKTTLARKLSEAFGAPVVHMDDFFLPFEKRTPGRLALPGGNFDLERFMEEVYAPLSRGEGFSYGVFDCSRGVIGAERTIPRAEIVIVEGAYSLHPELQPLYGLRIFCDVDKKAQLERLKKRESSASFESFVEKWIPMEEKYLEAFNIRGICDVVFP